MASRVGKSYGWQVVVIAPLIPEAKNYYGNIADDNYKPFLKNRLKNKKQKKGEANTNLKKFNVRKGILTYDGTLLHTTNGGISLKKNNSE